MPRGPDLSPNEVAMLHSKIKQFWDYEKAQIKYGGTKEILKSCKISGIPCSERTLRRISAEMKAQELASDQIFEETGEVAGLDFTSNRVGKCGRLSQLSGREHQRLGILSFSQDSRQAKIFSLRQQGGDDGKRAQNF